MKIHRLAYITSMATGGLAGFNYKELIELQRLGVEIELFITKALPGPYMPPPGVPMTTIRIVPILLHFLVSLACRPVRTLPLVMQSLRNRCFHDLLIACHWAAHVQAKQSDWIHCHWGDHKLYIGYFVHRLTGIPLSVTLHGYDLYTNPNWVMCEVALRACARIITISEYNKRLLVQRFGDLGERVRVIRLFTEMIEKPTFLKDVVKILIVGGFQDRKGYDILLKALAQLAREDLHLWIVGYKGPVDVRGLVRDLGLQKSVTILGHISDEVLKIVYTFSDIFVMPSRIDKDGVGEGLPVALMEAMSYEKPIVATQHTGIPELVPDILVPENDIEGLAAGLARLADNPKLRREMGARNRSIVAQQYSKANVEALLATLES
jgi:glycosyltransferase involved in cell wall biosynthesis